MVRYRLLMTASVSLLVACSHDMSATGADAARTMDRDLGRSGDPDPDCGAVRLRVGPLPIDPGQERTQCLTGHFGGSCALNVVQIDATQHSTHHVIFYREDPAAADAALHDCQPLNINPFGVGTKAPLFIGETPQAQLKMPPNVAYPFAAGAPYTIEIHYMNAGNKPVSADAELVLTLAKPGQEVTRAEMLFYASITPLDKNYDGKQKGIPPHQQLTLDPPGFARPPAGIKLFGLTSHQHRIGTEFVISRSRGASDAGQELFRNTDWQHPPLLRFPDDGLLTFAAGEGLRWTCSYNNTNDFYVTFGQSALRNEMCILWGYYFPAKGFDIQFQ